jgi:hypothetical protein
MSLVAPRASGPSMDTSTGMYAPQITGKIAGEDLLACAPCYIKASDGKIYQSNGTAVNAAADVVGFSVEARKAGQPCTLRALGTRVGYADAGGLTPGAKYFLAATAGRLDTAATTGGTVAIARAIDDTDLIILAI